VAFVGVEQGILLAIVVSLIDRLRRQYHPHADVLVSDGSVAARLAPRIALRGALPPGALDDVLVYRFGAPLFFANATFFAEQVRALRAGAKHPVHLMVLDCAAMDDIDYTGAQTMAELGRELRADGGELVVTEASDAALTMLQDSGAAADLSLVPRIEDAVRVRPSAPDAAPAG
jgi:MFS superfamily sulfate permease-like transporter